MQKNKSCGRRLELEVGTLDKFEYKVRAEEIKSLIAQGEYVEAVKIADTIDWHRVKSVMMLCTISDLYKINRRFEESKELLLLAYDRHPGGRTIVYSLCELSIKMEEYVQAIEYYKEFVQIAPRDTGRYILQYKLYEAQDVSLEERIAVLEELKKRDYREKWAYELAYLYHRIGLSTKCVEECDELILWFGEGKYVIKAMELKMLHQPLTQDQEKRYNMQMRGISMYAQEQQEEEAQEQAEAAGTQDAPVQDAVLHAVTTRITDEELSQIQVKTLDMGQYNTINLQKELAASMKELLEDGSDVDETLENQEEDRITKAIMAPMFQNTAEMEEEKNAQAVKEPEVAAQEVFFEETAQMAPVVEEQPVVEEAPVIEEQPVVQEAPIIEEQPQVVAPQGGMQEITELFVAEEPEAATQEVVQAEPAVTEEVAVEEVIDEVVEEAAEEVVNEVVEETPEIPEETVEVEETAVEEEVVVEEATVEEPVAEAPQESAPAEEPAVAEETPVQLTFTPQIAPLSDGTATYQILPEVPTQLAGMLSQEYDGQISLVMPEGDKVEKQITGQMSIEDILQEWERMKKDNEEKRREDVRRRVQEQTGNLFAEFDQSTRSGILAQLEELDAEVREKEAEKPPITPYKDQPIAKETEAALKEAKAAKRAPKLPSQPPKSAMEISEDEMEDIVDGRMDVRQLTDEEKELFNPFIHTRKAKEQFIKSIDSISLAAYTGNVIVTGDDRNETIALAKNIVREVQMIDGNFSGKVAKVSGSVLNSKDIPSTLSRMENGAVIIESAVDMTDETVSKLFKYLDRENKGIIVIIEGTKKEINKFMKQHDELKNCFCSRFDIEALDNDALVAYGRKYAEQLEYSIDELGMLALHTRISDMQTSTHAVNVGEVQEIIEEAIDNANRKNLKHFFDVLLGKRYDEEDMIILRERDFDY